MNAPIYFCKPENSLVQKVRKVRYSQEFIRRLKKVSKSLRAAGIKAPTRKQLEAAIRKGELSAHVPLIDLEAHNRAHGAETVQMSAVTNGGGGFRPPEFVDFSGIKKPAPDEMDEATLKAYADELCRAMGMNV